MVNILKKWLIDSQIYVSLMGCFWCAFFLPESKIFSFVTFSIIFITFWGGYLYTKYHSAKHWKRTLLFNGLLGAICLFLMLKFKNSAFIGHWLFIVLLGFLYNSHFLKFYVRKIPFLKIFYVGLVWGLTATWLGLGFWNLSIFGISFFYIASLVLPFDIRDMQSDTTMTFPKLMGVQKTKYLAYVGIFLALLLSIFFLRFEWSLAFFISSILAYSLIYYTKNNRNELYFSFALESCCGLPFLFLIILKYF